MTARLEITRYGSGWYVWTVPDHQIVSRRFVERGEAAAELSRRLSVEERLAAFNRPSRAELRGD